MKKYLITVLIILFGLSISKAQSGRMSFKNEDISQLLSMDIYTVPNSETENLIFLLGDQKDLWVYKYDKNYKKVLDFKLDNNFHGIYEKVIGYQVRGNSFDLIAPNSSMKKFEILSFNIDDRSLIKKEADFKFSKKEKYLNSFQVGNSFFLLSSDKESTLFIRKLDEDGEFELLKKFKLDEFDNSGTQISLKKLYTPDLLRTQDFNLFTGFNGENLQTINYRMPTSLSVTSQKTKIYQDESIIHLVMEIEDEFTAIGTIDLISLTMEKNIIPYIKDEYGRYNDHNSYLYKNTLYQISASNDAMILQIKNMQGQVLNQFTLHEGQKKIEFSNTPIMVEGYGYYRYNRELEEPKKFLRKLMKSDMGINVIEKNNNFIIQIGSSDDREASSYPNFTTPSQWSTQISVLLDKDYQHLSGEIEPTNFDLLSDYQMNKRYKISSYVHSNQESVFLGYYNYPSEEFRLIEF
ncbi:hypothetical protein [Gillisia sp. JM1]|uniref:hypothetical protein n=1 Tax=Gillisia sp. JM1 TaxID=1283286 RepID=UPI0003FC51BC|nr:hypothetical protein [Gillisia sp. JM1]